MSNRDYFDYRIRIQVPRGSSDAILLESLKHDLHPTFSHREMVLWALRGYWLPTAYQLQNRQGEAIADDELKHGPGCHPSLEGADFLHRDDVRGGDC